MSRMNAPAFGKAHRKKRTSVFVTIPAMEADNYLAVSRPKNPSDHFGGSGDYPRAFFEIVIANYRLFPCNPPTRQNASIYSLWAVKSWNSVVIIRVCDALPASAHPMGSRKSDSLMFQG